MPRSEGRQKPKMVCDLLPSWVRTDTPGQHYHAITVHLDGHEHGKIHLPLRTATFVLQLEPGIVVVVGANLVVAAEPGIQHAKIPSVLWNWK